MKLSFFNVALLVLSPLANADGGAGDFWAAAKSGNAKTGEFAQNYGPSGACPELSGWLDPGGYLPASATIFKDRVAQLKKLNQELNQADAAKYMIPTQVMVFDRACTNMQTHRQDPTANGKVTEAGKALTGSVDKLKAALEASWQDGDKLSTMLNDEIKKREEIAKQLPAAHDAMNNGKKADQLCQKRLGFLVETLKNNGAYAESLADKMKACAGK